MRSLMILFLISLMSCGNQDIVTLDSDSLTFEENIIPDEQKQDVPDQEVQKYSFENDTLLQSLEVKFLSERQIDFVLVSTNKAKDKSDKIEGEARSKSNVDPEIDEDEEGEAYPVQEYIFEKGCWLYFRIDMRSKDKIRIVEADCDQQHDKSCPFGSIGILRRK